MQQRKRQRSDPECSRGRTVRWIGLRHGRRQDRRWAAAWSPVQIAHRLQLDFPDHPSMRISQEAIYQASFVQGRGAVRRELTACHAPDVRCRSRGHANATSSSIPVAWFYEPG